MKVLTPSSERSELEGIAGAHFISGSKIATKLSGLD